MACCGKRQPDPGQDDESPSGEAVNEEKVRPGKSKKNAKGAKGTKSGKSGKSGKKGKEEKEAKEKKESRKSEPSLTSTYERGVRTDSEEDDPKTKKRQRRERPARQAEVSKPLRVSRDYGFINTDGTFKRGRYNVDDFEIKWRSADDYEISRRNSIGEGAFGEVFLAKKVSTGEICVAKCIRSDKEKKSALQVEVKMCRLLSRGPDIVQLWDTVTDKRGTKMLIFEYIKNPRYKKTFSRLDDLGARHYLYHMLRALHYIHSQGIVHRDVKGANVLYDPKSKSLRVIDLGFCAFYFPKVRWTNWPGTRSYKSPDMFLRYEYYDYSCDVWSFACVMGQLIFQRKSMFNSDRGGSDRDLGNLNHMIAVVKFLGTDDYDAFYHKFARDCRGADKFPPKLFVTNNCKRRKVNWNRLVNGSNKHLAVPDAVDLLDQLLVYDHEERITAREALQHRYFDPVRIQDDDFDCPPSDGDPQLSDDDDAGGASTRHSTGSRRRRRTRASSDEMVDVTMS